MISMSGVIFLSAHFVFVYSENSILQISTDKALKNTLFVITKVTSAPDEKAPPSSE